MSHKLFTNIIWGEKSGVTLHEIDRGIDTGKIIDKQVFKVDINATSYNNYLKLLEKSVTLFKKNIKKILEDKYTSKRQNLNKGSYFSRKSVNYKKIIYFNKINNDLLTHNRIRTLIFPPFQLPIYNGKKIIKSIFRNSKIKLSYLK